MNIRRTGAALIGCVCASAVHAQTPQAPQAQVYGIVDASVRRTSGLAEFAPSPGSTTTLSSGVNSTSRIGFRGTEDLGGGLRASFQLETGVNVDSGVTANTTKFFDRQSWVGIGGGWGTLSLGRQTTTLADGIGPIDPLATRLASFNPNINIAALSQHGLAAQYGPAGSTTGSYRLDNSAKYTVRLADFTLRAMAGAGEQVNNAKLLDAYGGGVAYQKDQFALSASYMHFRDVSGRPLEAWIVGGAVPAGPLVLKLTYGDSEARTSAVNTTGNRTIGAGASLPLSTFEFTLAHYDVARERTGLADDGFRRTVAFAEYVLSRRTKLYAEGDTTRWKNNYQGAANKSRGSGFSLGLMQTF